MNLSLNAIFNHANQLLRGNNLNEALPLFEKIIELQPNHLPTLITLGNIFQQNGNLVKAKYFYEKSLLQDNHNSQLIFNLAIIFFKLNDFKNSLFNFNKLISKNSDFKYLRYNLTNVMRSKKILDLKNTNKELVKDLFLHLFRNNDIDHSAISTNVLHFLYDYKKLENLNEEDNLISKNFVKKLVNQEIFQLVLQKSIISDINLEKTLTIVRYELLLEIINKKNSTIENYKNFLNSLAEQCWLNEYIWFESKDEKNQIKILQKRVENDDEINELEIAILACYFPLNSLKKVVTKLKNYTSDNIFFNDLITLQIKEPNIEKEIKKNINSISKITNKISEEVKNQYEENPYPRWRYCNQLFSMNLEDDVNYQIRPNMINLQKKSGKIKILLAGCGTGKHLISIGKYANSNILAIDLSLASLAYAKRKVDEFNYNNIQFLHSDILELENLDQKFDIIESAGTLHHMEKPNDGLKCLLKVLKPNGLLRLGLYSELARKDIVKLREIIKTKNFEPNIDGIRKIREFILSQNKTNNTFSTVLTKDFYSTSMIRDLLFHVKEHRYTIPKLIETLRDFNLEFLGFVFANNNIKFQYSKIFPSDKKMTNLENWNKFEIKYPDIFLGMYQFYVKKINENN